MANAVEKVNAVAIADIQAINGKTDANIQAFNALEFTGTPPFVRSTGLTWTAGATETHRGGHNGTGNLEAFLIIGGWL